MRRMKEHKLVQIAKGQLNEQGRILIPQTLINPYSIVYILIHNYDSGSGIIPLNYRYGTSAPIHHGDYPGSSRWAYATLGTIGSDYYVEVKNYTDNKPVTGLWVSVSLEM